MTETCVSARAWRQRGGEEERGGGGRRGEGGRKERGERGREREEGYKQTTGMKGQYLSWVDPTTNCKQQEFTNTMTPADPSQVPYCQECNNHLKMSDLLACSVSVAHSHGGQRHTCLCLCVVCVGRGGRGRALVEAMLLIQSLTNFPHLQRRSLLHQMSLSRSLLSGGGS